MTVPHALPHYPATELYLENDAGLANAGGNYTGQYKRSEVVCDIWVHPSNYRSRHFGDPDVVDFVIW